MKGTFTVAVLVLLFAAGTAVADLHNDTFSAVIDEEGLVTQGDMCPNTGYNNGEWYYYPNTGWWNEWFYDDPPKPFPYWKRINYNICIDAPMGYGGEVEIVINWSSMLYPEDPAMPPLPELFVNNPGLEDDWIVRTERVYLGQVDELMTFDDTIIIDDFNPEWVSIDIRRIDEDPTLVNVIEVWGCIEHECIPEPATMSLLAFGVLLPLLRRKK